MADNRRGKKQNANKNHIAYQEWMVGKKLGRTKQKWVWHDLMGNPNMERWGFPLGHWEKI